MNNKWNSNDWLHIIKLNILKLKYRKYIKKITNIFYKSLLIQIFLTYNITDANLIIIIPYFINLYDKKTSNVIKETSNNKLQENLHNLRDKK